MIRAGMAVVIGGVAMLSIGADGGDLSRWVVSEPPSHGSDRWREANRDADREWVVSVGAEGPRAGLRRPRGERDAPLPFAIAGGMAAEGLAGERTSLRVEDGWIVGFNAGEFGAGVWWFAPDGSSRARISGDHLVGLIPDEAGPLGLVGLAHLSRSEGWVVRFVREGPGRWRVEDVVDLGHAPETGMRGGDRSLVVATTGRLVRVDPKAKRVEAIVADAFWGGLYPNSLAIGPGGTVFVGMRHGVARVETAGGVVKVDWLRPGE